MVVTDKWRKGLSDISYLLLAQEEEDEKKDVMPRLDMMILYICVIEQPANLTCFLWTLLKPSVEQRAKWINWMQY